MTARLPLTVADARPDRDFRCSTGSRERGEALTATASTVSRFLLMEEPGPWGPAVLNCYRVPDPVRLLADEWERDLGVRPLLIRRPGRSTPAQRRVFVVDADLGWVETCVVDALDDVGSLDLSGLGTGDGVGLQRHHDPLFLVCTHGRHDACCAERGRPLAAALAARWPDFVWESSHLGGDRFSANMVALPSGQYYGRLEPEVGVRVVEDHLSGRITLAHHRGQSNRSWVEQAAEAQVRSRLGETRLGAVATRFLVRDGDTARVEVVVGGEAHEVVVEVGKSSPERLTCTSAPKSAPTYRVEHQTGF